MGFVNLRKVALPEQVRELEDVVLYLLVDGGIIVGRLVSDHSDKY